MSNSEHIKWLLEGVGAWNERHQNVPGKGYPYTPDLRSALVLGISRSWQAGRPRKNPPGWRGPC